MSQPLEAQRIRLDQIQDADAAVHAKDQPVNKDEAALIEALQTGEIAAAKPEQPPDQP